MESDDAYDESLMIDNGEKPCKWNRCNRYTVGTLRKHFFITVADIIVDCPTQLISVSDIWYLFGISSVNRQMQKTQQENLQQLHISNRFR